MSTFIYHKRYSIRLFYFIIFYYLILGQQSDYWVGRIALHSCKEGASESSCVIHMSYHVNLSWNSLLVSGQIKNINHSARLLLSNQLASPSIPSVSQLYSAQLVPMAGWELHVTDFESSISKPTIVKIKSSNYSKCNTDQPILLPFLHPPFNSLYLAERCISMTTIVFSLFKEEWELTVLFFSLFENAPEFQIHSKLGDLYKIEMFSDATVTRKNSLLFPNTLTLT